MVPDSSLVTVSVGFGVALVGYLIRSRGWTFLVPGVRRGLPFPEWAGEVVGVHAIGVGMLVVGVGLLGVAGVTSDLLRTAVGVVVVVSTVAMPFWGPRYLAWRTRDGDQLGAG